MNDKAKICPSCGEKLTIFDFFLNKDIDKYPDGRLSICKDCVCRDINIYDPLTFIPILQELDVPYIQFEWDKYIINAISQDKEPTSRMILGKYLSYMNLRGFRHLRYEDSNRIKEDECRRAAFKLRKEREEFKKNHEPLL